MMRLVPLFIVFFLAACGGGDADRAPVHATPDEAKALDDAAEMIGVRRPPVTPVSSPSSAAVP